MEKINVLFIIFVVWAVCRVVKCFIQENNYDIIPEVIAEYLPDVIYYLVLTIVVIVKSALLPLILCGVIYIIFF